MSTLLWIPVFILGLIATVVAAELFINHLTKPSATKEAPRIFGFIAATFLVALPELFIALIATGKDYSSVVPTYVTGANLINLLLIPGLMALATGSFTAQKDTTVKQIPMLFASIILFLVLSVDGHVSALEGVFLLLAFAAYAAARYGDYKLGLIEKIERLFLFGKSQSMAPAALLWLLVLSAGAYLTVTGMTSISNELSWNPGYLASSIVALAVSVPEIIYSIRCAKKGESDKALTVLMASTIVNSTLVIAIPSFIKNLTVLDDVASIGSTFMLVAAILFSLFFLHRKWSFYEGSVLVLIYIIFLIQFLNPLFS